MSVHQSCEHCAIVAPHPPIDPSHSAEFTLAERMERKDKQLVISGGDGGGGVVELSAAGRSCCLVTCLLTP